MRKPFVAGNWKMNKSIDEARALARGVAEGVRGLDVDVVVAPVSAQLQAVSEAIGSGSVAVSSQNMHWAASGAYTGELSASMIKEVGCTYTILGHSERRQYFGETDEGVNRRAQAALAADITPIICIGEHLAERKSGWTKDKVRMQVRAALSGLSADEVARSVIAYEPIWAIGTGETASPEQAQEVHGFIREMLEADYGESVGQKTRILYGGSVKPHNIEELIAQTDIDGALVGGASLGVDSFVAIARACHES